MCGTHEGKIRFMINDQGKHIKAAYPGEAVHVGGFKHFPDVGNPLYAVKDHEEAQFIVNTIRSRLEREAALNSVDHSQKAHELKKSVKGLSKIEKRKLYGGDKTILYEKLGLVEENDLEKYRKKFGIKKGIDLASIDLEDVDSILENAKIAKELNSTVEPSKKRRSGLKIAKEEFDIAEFKKIIGDLQKEKQLMDMMDDDEKK